ncbi:MAG: hypothetical protein AB7N24_13000 [Dehalococcoidia bacterium]
MRSKTIAVAAVLALLGLAVIFPVAAYGGGDDENGQQVQSLDAISSSFSFQGRLSTAGVPADGSYDFDFYLYDSLAGGNQVGSTISMAAVPVAAGLFTVDLDFGDVFHGAQYYLEIQVRPAGGGSFTVLSPRETLGAVPNAHYASEAGNIRLPYSASTSYDGAMMEISNSSAFANAITLLAEAGAGRAIVGTSGTGTAGLFSSSGGTALDIDGAIKVSGSHPAAFVHVASGGGYISVIDNPILNGDPNAIVIATHVYDPPGAGGTIYQSHPYSVWYNGANWTIYNDDLSPMTANTAFFVLVIKR